MTSMGYYSSMPVPTHPQMHPYPNYLPPGSLTTSYYPGYPPTSMMPLPAGMASRPVSGYFPPVPNIYSPPGPIFPPSTTGSYPHTPHIYHPHAYNIPNPYANPNIGMNYPQQQHIN
jgi:hypothetical protein